MLRKWEAEDKDVRELWEKMNGWVYDGFHTTYKRIGVDFKELSEKYTEHKKIDSNMYM